MTDDANNAPTQDAVPQTPPAVPQITVPNCTESLEWYTKVFGAKLLNKHVAKDDKILHASLQLSNGAQIFLSDDFPDMNNGKSNLPDPSRRPYTTHLTFDHAEQLHAVWNGAVHNGATPEHELGKQPWGQMYGNFHDPMGHSWSIGEPFEDKPTDTQEEKSDESTAVTGNKRRLETGGDEPPTKRARLTASAVGVEHGANEVRTDFNVWRGLFMEFNCGKEGTGADCTFAEASKTGLGTVWKAINDAGFHDQIGPVMAFCPEDPSVREPARYAPGMLLKPGVDIEAIAATNEKFVVREVPAGKWFVQVHVGSYMNMNPSWASVKEEAAKFGRIVPQLCHERYVNDPSSVAEEELITEIWLKFE